jgi:MFS family permease
VSRHGPEIEELGGFDRALLALTKAMRRLADALRGRLVVFVGGSPRARVITMFACVLALNSAQVATIGAVAPQLESSLHIGNTKVGLLNSVALLVGAIATIPVGMLVDRVRRIPVLAASILLWSGATLWGAVAGSYSSLLLSRVGLGAVAATAGPAIASLTGDYFPARERARVYGYILAGEIAGTAAGFVVSGTIASVLSWRISLVVLALPGFWLARELARTVPEPERGGQSRLAHGALDFAETAGPDEPPGDDAEAATVVHDRDPARDAARRRGVRPNPRMVLRSDPREMGIFRAISYVMRVPSNVLMILGSSLGYFYFAGLQTFALVFLRGHYQASEATATLVLVLLVLGALIGTLVSGPATDALVRRGFLQARVWLPGYCYLGAAVLLAIGLLNNHLTPAIWFDVGGAALISAANPPLDAARLDIMPSGLWGRAESIRTFLRSGTQALAPLLFGGVADLVAGFVPKQAPIGTHSHEVVSQSTGTGLQVSFLIMVTTLAAGGFFLLRARVTYPTDVATAAASWSPGAS